MAECPECGTYEESKYIEKHGKCYNCIAREREIEGEPPLDDSKAWGF